MPYTINKTDGTLLITLPDQTADTSVSPLTLIGRGLLNYGKSEAENIIHLLENFANATAPTNPLLGQFWYDKSTSKMKVWNGTVWNRVYLSVDDANLIPGLTIGAGLTLTSGTLSANVRSVAGRSADVTLGIADIAGGAPLASPVFTGTPSGPTPATGTTTTQLATTAYVRAQILADTLNYGAGAGLQVSGSNLSVLGTTNRITVSGSGVDIASTYAGQNSISTLGNITSGQWSAAPIPVAYGGTGGTSAAAARANIQALLYNDLANSLGSVTNGLLINSSGTAVARTVVSGTPDTLSVTNGDGVGGNITISLLGTQNGAIPITGGGTGATTKTAAFNALSPATTYGDILVYGVGGHERLAGKTDAPAYYLMSGVNEAKARWTSTVDASTLNGQAGPYYLDRGNHTGANDASTLQTHPGSYYLDYANFTGNIPANAVFAGSSPVSTMSTGDSGYVKFSGGFTIQWGRIMGYWSSEFVYSLTFPVAFTTAFNITATDISPATFDSYHDWYWQIQDGTISATGAGIQLQQTSNFKGTAARGFYWMAFGYIA